MTTRELVVITSLPSAEVGTRVLLTKKLVSGLERYVELWGGPVRVLLPPGAPSTGSGNLDDVFVERAALPFSVDVVPLGSAAMRARLQDAAIVLGGADYRLHGTARHLKERGVPYVFNTEYTLRTRCQIVRAEQKNPLRVARQFFWEWQQERAYLGEVKDASGVQCNGVPTYQSYREHSASPFLYFDTRTEEDMLISEDAFSKKWATKRPGPVRLAFSGRLNAMKGADDLPRVAQALAERGVDFQLDICGGGTSEPEMRALVERFGLSDRVRFRGTLDFAGELIPFLKDEIDLFVCCHRQGDPSCTYLETFACGVPIAGYANEAFAGLLDHVDAGFSTPLNDPDKLAERIATLVARPDPLRSAARAARDFASGHTFDATFRRRIEHLRSLARA